MSFRDIIRGGKKLSPLVLIWSNEQEQRLVMFACKLLIALLAITSGTGAPRGNSNRSLQASPTINYQLDRKLVLGNDFCL